MSTRLPNGILAVIQIPDAAAERTPEAFGFTLLLLPAFISIFLRRKKSD